ncbi:uncharacterized protein LOC132282204 [Cornus florida]|uniref:uncharacterized protein LOC132282204 n=1 Tax=Cornus florida TaxID=4283 RepID=UPI00289A6EA5|nr:uncharacterized protein LOC132282204 [Cornus florida]
MEQPTHAHMEKPVKIMRRSIYTFLQYYQYFTTRPVLLIIPFSASVLLSQAVFASSPPPLLIIHGCYNSLFHTLRFSSPSQFVSLLNLNLSQTIFTSVFILPFALTSLVIAKSFIIQALIHHKSSLPLPSSSFRPVYKPLLLTQLCNLVLIIIVNVIAFSVLFLVFQSLDAFGFSTNNLLVLVSAKTVFYSFIANAGVICNLALVVAGVENCIGCMAIWKACLLSWKRKSMTLSMNLPVNLSILAIEGLFKYRVVRAYRLSGRLGPSMALEGMLISYLYSLLIVLDTIASCLFFKSCNTNYQTDNTEGIYYYHIRIVKKDDGNCSANSEFKC